MSYYVPLAVMFVLAMSLLFSLVSTGLMIVAVATDYWEHTDWSGDQLRNLSNLNKNESYFSDNDRFYKIVLTDMNSDNLTYREYFLRSSFGGVWKICDYITEEGKRAPAYQDGVVKTSFMKYNCFDYINEYGIRKQELDKRTGVWLVRMQNSAASCMIVSLMCLLTAAITGTFGIVTKQVSSCMVTGVMYIVGGVFVCFGLVIMHTKVEYSSTQCSTLDPMGDIIVPVCDAKTVSIGWSISIAWIGFSFLLLAFVSWLFLARILRLEKAKSML